MGTEHRAYLFVGLASLGIATLLVACGDGQLQGTERLHDDSQAPGSPEESAGAPVPPSSLEPAAGPRPWAHSTGPTNPDAIETIPNVTIEQDGTVLENFETGSVRIEAKNVVLRNFRTNSGLYGVRVLPGASATLEDGEISGADSAGVYSQNSVIIRRMYIHDCNTDAIKIEGNGPSLVEGSFIERLGSNPEAHADGIQSKTAQNVTVRGNNIYMPSPGTPDYPGEPIKSNATYIVEDTAANIVIDSNWLTGGSYTVYCTGTGPVFVRNNIFGRYNGGWPDKEERRLRTGSGCVEWTNNRWEDTGELIN